MNLSMNDFMLGMNNAEVRQLNVLTARLRSAYCIDKTIAMHIEHASYRKPLSK